MRRTLCVAGAILLLVAGLAWLGPRLWYPIGCSHNLMTARAKCKEYHDAALFWARVRGGPPVSLGEMEAPLRPGESPFEEVVDDPWGHPYVLERGGTDVRVRCVGPDGTAGTDDDIVYPE